MYHVIVLTHAQKGKKKRTYVGGTDNVYRTLFAINMAMDDETRAAAPHWRPVVVTGGMTAAACTAFTTELNMGPHGCRNRMLHALRLGAKYDVVVYSRRVPMTPAAEYTHLVAHMPAGKRAPICQAYWRQWQGMRAKQQHPGTDDPPPTQHDEKEEEEEEEKKEGGEIY